MFKRIRCFFSDHDWVLGRVAGSYEHQKLRWSNYHNRVCSKCGKRDMAADRADEALHKMGLLRSRMMDGNATLAGKLEAQERLDALEEKKRKRKAMKDLRKHEKGREQREIDEMMEILETDI